jgi:hypothetical protein
MKGVFQQMYLWHLPMLQWKQEMYMRAGFGVNDSCDIRYKVSVQTHDVLMHLTPVFRGKDFVVDHRPRSFPVAWVR